MKPQVQNQGTVVAEWDAEDAHWLVMFPDGTVLSAKTNRQAQRLAKKWFKDHVDAGKIGVGKVEYRRTP